VQIKVSALPQQVGWQLALVDATERRQMIRNLRLSEERWSLALEAAGDGVWDWNIQTDAVLFSRGYAELFGFSEHEYGKHIEDWRSRIHPQDKPGVMADVQANLTGQTDRLFNEHRCRSKDGQWKWVLNRAAIVSRTPDGLPLRMIGTITDITKIKKTEEALKLAARFQQAVFDSLAAHTMVLDRSGKIIQANLAWQAYAQETGCAQGDATLGAQYLDILACLTGTNHDASDMANAVREGLAQVTSGVVASFQIKSPIFVPVKQHWFSMKVTAVGDSDERVVVSHEDVTLLKQAELVSLALANTDVLTGALSRRNFLDLAETELARAKRYQLPLMLLMLDLDHFKLVNDQHGHAAGDVVLQDFVLAVSGVLRESDLVGRLGGEEFAVLLPNTTADGGNTLAQRIIESVRARAVAVGDASIHYSVSIGASQLTSESTVAELLSLADAALYRAKEGGRDRLEGAVT
jgi:diguanylate cyclase (GGDEF)-like protein/PAS domain S-box-containing protein